VPSASQQISRPPTHCTIDVRSINTLAPVKISRATLNVYKGALRVRLSETLRLAAARRSSIRDIRWSKIDCGTRKVGINRKPRYELVGEDRTRRVEGPRTTSATPFRRQRSGPQCRTGCTANSACVSLLVAERAQCDNCVNPTTTSPAAAGNAKRAGSLPAAKVSGRMPSAR
jgi:hypothetical protein